MQYFDKKNFLKDVFIIVVGGEGATETLLHCCSCTYMYVYTRFTLLYSTSCSHGWMDRVLDLRPKEYGFDSHCWLQEEVLGKFLIPCCLWPPIL